MIVEFIGAPGAGKTTLMPNVIETLQERGIRAFTVVDAARPFAERTLLGKTVFQFTPRSLRRPLLWQLFYRLSTLYRLKFFVKYPRLIYHVLSTQRHRPKSADIRERRVLYWFFRTVGYYEFLKAQARPNEALILDEGFVHRVVQLYASGVEAPNPTQILAYVDLLPKPDLVIFTQAPPEVCEKRIYSRGLWERFRHKDPAEISRFVANACQIVNLTVDHIRNAGWVVVEVDNGADDLMASTAELDRMLSQITLEADQGPELQTV
jgi:thymidylate kinase